MPASEVQERAVAVLEQSTEKEHKKQDQKEDNPKAPQPIIGMQDERGARKFIYIPH
jgi:hypothetical protein